MPTLDTILEVASRRLPSEGIPVLLVGGFAVNYYGFTRFTLDADFLIVAEHAAQVRRVVADAGFINIITKENMMRCSAPSCPLRADFLYTDAQTMHRLLPRAEEADIRGYALKVPSLRDLLGMKIFALHQAPTARLPKDLADIAWLGVLNALDIEKDIRPLCTQFGSPALLDMIKAEMEKLSEEE